MLFLIQMLEFLLGVACGAEKCLYFTPKVMLSRYFWFWVARRGKMLKHFGPKTMEIVKHDKYFMFPPCSRNKKKPRGTYDLRVCAGRMARCHTYIYIYIYIYICVYIYISVNKVWSTRVASWDISQAAACIFVTLNAK